jgi:hypothetical protein
MVLETNTAKSVSFWVSEYGRYIFEPESEGLESSGLTGQHKLTKTQVLAPRIYPASDSSMRAAEKSRVVDSAIVLFGCLIA